MGKAKTEKSAARNTDAATSAMRTGTTTQQEKPQNQVKGAKFKTTKISPNSMGTNVSRVINDEAMLLEKISSIPTMCTLFAIFAGPIGFFGLQGSSELGTCAEKNDACMSSCMADWTESVAGLRGANKFAVQQAADGTLAVCESRCQEVKSQCDFEAMLKILACLGLAGIVLCVALRANVNYFVDQNIAAMEQTIAEEAAEMTRKAKKEEQKGSGAASPGRKKGTKKMRGPTLRCGHIILVAAVRVAVVRGQEGRLHPRTVKPTPRQAGVKNQARSQQM
ncbi:unnamed protein product [Amoebophrya sp. A25]|nr:unnamed protein product [Amoebophrya sp. A25]|eukprot:GSA25T00013314001.1